MVQELCERERGSKRETGTEIEQHWLGTEIEKHSQRCELPTAWALRRFDLCTWSANLTPQHARHSYAVCASCADHEKPTKTKLKLALLAFGQLAVALELV